LPQKKMTRGKIHSQNGQRCEHPNLSGNCPSQSLMMQISSRQKYKRDDVKIGGGMRGNE